MPAATRVIQKRDSAFLGWDIFWGNLEHILEHAGSIEWFLCIPTITYEKRGKNISVSRKIFRKNFFAVEIQGVLPLPYPAQASYYCFFD